MSRIVFSPVTTFTVNPGDQFMMDTERKSVTILRANRSFDIIDIELDAKVAAPNVKAARIGRVSSVEVSRFDQDLLDWLRNNGPSKLSRIVATHGITDTKSMGYREFVSSIQRLFTDGLIKRDDQNGRQTGFTYTAN